MSLSNEQQRSLQTTAGEFPLHEYRLRLAEHEWTILHTKAMLTYADEAHLFMELRNLLPYGVVLWPAAIALAHDVAARADAFTGKRVLELGAGTGLPGIVAASLGAQVVQTDRLELAMELCKRNGALNNIQTITYRAVDWTTWEDTARYDWIIGSDILYGEALHPHLLQIFETNLAPGGRVLLSDPFRSASLRMLEGMEAQGWSISVSKWSIGEDESPRPFGVFEIMPPQ